MQRNNDNINLRDNGKYYLPRRRTDQISRFLTLIYPDFGISSHLIYPQHLTDSPILMQQPTTFLKILSNTSICNRLLCSSFIVNNVIQHNSCLPLFPLFYWWGPLPGRQPNPTYALINFRSELVLSLLFYITLRSSDILSSLFSIIFPHRQVYGHGHTQRYT
jgi:hypothetical protein